jgi:CheY-like chemotaxis protein
VFECDDTGAGISAALLPRLFLPFVQGEQGIDRQKGGLGLGLAVAKAVVEAHGGSIEARSIGLGQGSTFVMRLPLAVVPDVVAPATAGPRDAGQRPHAGRVLVVDDNQDSVGTLVAILAASGFDAVGVGDAPEACEMFERGGADVAILDIGLPSMSGFDLVARLRAMPGGGSTRFVALTGYGQDKDARLGREAGFDLYLVKPVAVDDLLAHLNALLDERDRLTPPPPSTDRTDTRGADSA